MGEENTVSEERTDEFSRFFTPPRKSEVPWSQSPPFLLGHAIFLAALVVAIIVFDWRLIDRPILPEALFFVFGAGVGLITLRPMTKYFAANWPWQKLRREFTGNRFWTLKAPTFSPAYWRKVRELKTELARQGKSTEIIKFKTLLLLAAIILGLLLVLLIDWQFINPAGPFLTFLGWMLTGMNLPLYLWWRSLPE